MLVKVVSLVFVKMWWSGGLTCFGEMDEVCLLALLWSRDMRRHEWIHKSLKVGPPPLCQALAYLPIASLLAFAQPADWR